MSTLSYILLKSYTKKMKAYLDIVKNVLENGVKVDTRTGIKAYTIAGTIFEHDMSKGFPLLTTKKTPFKLVATELEFFINGITDKKWLQDKNNHIWDEWAKPQLAPYGHDEASKKKMLEERDLGQYMVFNGDILMLHMKIIIQTMMEKESTN